MPMDSIAELPNGLVVCGLHWRVCCGFCCLDFTYIAEMLEGETEVTEMMAADRREARLMGNNGDSEVEPVSRKVTAVNRASRVMGYVIPKKFHPLSTSDTPQSLFPPGINSDIKSPRRRFIHRANAKQFLIYTDGACLNNGRLDPSAGCSFVFRPDTDILQGRGYFIRFRLEDRGPTGEVHQETSNRAELRAVIAALRFRSWTWEGFNSFVIATDSTYVVEGVTSWVRGWLQRGWKTRTGAPVKNRDLWECLLEDLKRCDSHGLSVEFWRIPREWNTDADYHAKHAASEEALDDFSDFSTLSVGL